MRIRLILGLTLGIGAVLIGFVGRDRLEARSGRSTKIDEVVVTRSQPPSSLIEDLNYLVQDRLHTSDGAGMARMPSTPEHLKEYPGWSFFGADFAAEREREKAVVAELERQGWTVGLYLAGRALLNSPLTESGWVRAGYPNEGHYHDYSPPRTIGRPLMISGKPARNSLPTPRELWTIGQQSLVNLTTSDRFETSFGPWSVDVRPVRADRESCLQCHSTDKLTDQQVLNTHQKEQLEIGDALGVAIYVYARKPK